MGQTRANRDEDQNSEFGSIYDLSNRDLNKQISRNQTLSARKYNLYDALSLAWFIQL